jgi:hypothetical protein
MRTPLLLFGLPRSGTTWLGKIFDSHPDTLYWHEPDSVWRLPGSLLPDAEGGEPDEQALRDWLRQLQSSAPLKSQAKPPFFPKNYYGAARFQLRRLLILAASAWSRLGSAPSIPFLIPASHQDEVIPVWKSIESLGRLGLLHRHLPGLRSVHIIRHPCGYIASVLRGETRGKFDDVSPSSEDWGLFEMLVATPQAKAVDLDLADLREMHPLQRLAWRWVIFNTKAMEELQAEAGATICVYEKLCADPLGESQRLLAHCGLPWDKRTESFLDASTHGQKSSYYSVFKNPLSSAERWREELDEESIRLIMGVAGDSAPGRLYNESP